MKIILLGVFLFVFANTQAQEKFKTSDYDIRVDVVYSGLRFPWGFDFLPDGTVLITEKPGSLIHLNIKTGEAVKIGNVPPVKFNSQGGLLDVLVDPDFNKNAYIYLTFSEPRGNRSGTTAIRATLKGNSLQNILTLFQGNPAASASHHYGSRIRIAPDNYIYISHGDRGSSKKAQTFDNHFGKIVRLNKDGSIPKSNPFLNLPDAKPEIYSLGHRNPQGMAVHPKTGVIWINEHGARGGDEINIIRSGKNYGWPVISYGVNYNGSKIGIGTHKKGMVQPVFYWDPSIAPSGMTFYTGNLFPEWKGNLFVSSLKFGFISRLTINGEKIKEAERIFNGEFGRIRDIKVSPGGTLMFITDENSAKLYEITLIR